MTISRLMMNKSFYNDLSMLKEAVQIWEDCLPFVDKVKGLAFAVLFHPITPIMVQRGQERGGNVLGLPIDNTLVVATLCPTWDNVEDDEAVVDACKVYFDRLETSAKQRDVYHPYIYMNYAWDGQPVIDSYGEDNKAFLSAVSKKYDPNRIFQRAVPGGFKISSATAK